MKNRQKNWQFLLIIGMMCVFLTACATDNKTKLHADEPAVPDIPAKYIDAMQEYQEAQGDAKSLRIHGDILVTGIDDELLSEFFVLSFLCDTRDASGGYSKQLSVEIGKYADNDAVFSDSNSSQFINFRGMYASSAKILNDESIPETAKADLRENIESFNYEIISGKTMADAISCEYIDDSEITDDDSWVNAWGKTLTDESAKGTLGEKNALKKAKQYLGSMAFSYQGLVDQLKYEGYTDSEAVYGANNCGADWNEQAAKKAKQYLEHMAFSRDGLIEQLEYEGFTHSQAVYGVEANGY